jgi:hypothetical protein
MSLPGYFAVFGGKDFNFVIAKISVTTEITEFRRNFVRD